MKFHFFLFITQIMELRTIVLLLSIVELFKRKHIINGVLKLEKRGLPIPCLGLGFSAGGFWNGKLIGISMTSYLTLKGSSGESA